MRSCTRRKIGLWAALILAGASPAGSLAASSAEEQILTVERAVTAATTTDALTPYFAPDVVLYDMVGPTELHGWKAAKQNFAAQLAKIENFKIEILSISVCAAGKLGFAYSTQRLTFDPVGGGPRTTIVFRQTDLLKKTEGRWVIAHQHVSVPYDAATGQAVLSGSP